MALSRRKLRGLSGCALLLLALAVFLAGLEFSGGFGESPRVLDAAVYISASLALLAVGLIVSSLVPPPRETQI